MLPSQFLSDVLPISAIDLKEKLAQKVLIIDTRFINSIFNTGSIPNALFIGMQGNLEKWASILIPDKTIEIYLIAENHIDLNELFFRFKRIGFTQIGGYLEGGFDRWIQEKYPIEPYHFMDPTQFIQQIENINLQHLIDVRTENEFQYRHIKNSVLIPIEELNRSLYFFKPENQYYIICQGGYRSVIAASILKRNGIHHTIDVYGGLNNFR